MKTTFVIGFLSMLEQDFWNVSKDTGDIKLLFSTLFILKSISFWIMDADLWGAVGRCSARATEPTAWSILISSYWRNCLIRRNRENSHNCSIVESELRFNAYRELYQKRIFTQTDILLSYILKDNHSLKLKIVVQCNYFFYQRDELILLILN